MSSLLVTGGAGFIGTNFVRYWVKKNPDDSIIVLDALTYAACLDNLAPVSDSDKYRFVEGDICDRALLDQVLGDHRPEAVMHLAAESHVDRSINGPGAFIETNINGTYENEKLPLGEKDNQIIVCIFSTVYINLQLNDIEYSKQRVILLYL